MNEGSPCLTTRSWDLSVSYRSQRFMFTMWMVGVDAQLEIDNSKRHLLSRVAMEGVALLLQVRLLNHHSGNSLRPHHTVGPTIHLHKSHRDRMFKRRRAIRGTRKKNATNHTKLGSGSPVSIDKAYFHTCMPLYIIQSTQHRN